MSTTSTIETHDGLRLLVRHWAAAEPKAHLVLVHGLAEHSGRWEHVGAWFAARGYDTRSYDWRGYGRSDGPRGDFESFEHMIDDLEEVLAMTGDERPTFVYAQSLGGLIATAYAVSDRPQPAGYVLSAPALNANIPAPLRLAAKILPRVAPRLRLKSPIEGDHLSRDPAVAEAYFADPLLQLPQTTRSGAAILQAMDDTRAVLHRMRVPTLVIHGAEDELVPPAASAPLAAVAVCQRKLYPGYRHELHNEPDGDAVLADVVAWLDDRLKAVEPQNEA
jgi:alpha-beta hydrolase superfamily lysophospholipase